MPELTAKRDWMLAVTQRNHRMLPTSPWEAVWHGLAQWLGVSDGALGGVLPNAANFGNLLSAAQLFE